MSDNLYDFIADLHIHTVLSPCGSLDMSPINIIKEASKKDSISSALQTIMHQPIARLPLIFQKIMALQHFAVLRLQQKKRFIAWLFFRISIL